MPLMDNFAETTPGAVTDTFTATELGIGGETYPGQRWSGVQAGRLRSEGGKVYKLIKAGGVIAAGAAVKQDADNDATGNQFIASAAATDIVDGICETAIASGSYGYMTMPDGINSIASASVDGSGTAIVAGDRLMPSAVAGILVKATATNNACAIALAATALATRISVRLLNSPLKI